MDIRQALKEQYHAGLAMFADCIVKCPDDMWLAGEHPRQFWRIVFHGAFYTHLYLAQNEAAFQPWGGSRDGIHSDLWGDSAQETETYEKSEMLAYVHYIDAMIDSGVDSLDLESEETGFSWYMNMTKLSHQLVNLRHLQGHVGQLSELLLARGIDTNWVGKSRGFLNGR